MKALNFDIPLSVTSFSSKNVCKLRSSNLVREYFFVGGVIVFHNLVLYFVEEHLFDELIEEEGLGRFQENVAKK